MLNCLKPKPRKPETTRPINPTPTVGPKNNVPFAFVIGHNQSSQGAVNYLGESEFIFNSRIAKKCQLKLETNGVATAILYRPAGKSYSRQCKDVAKQAKELDVYFAYCLHFNDAESSKATGCEVLVRESTNPTMFKTADKLTDLLNEEMGFVERADDGVKTVNKRHNGFGMLNELYTKGCRAVIVEPCFARNRKQASKIFENEDKYVEILFRAIYALVTH